MMRILRKPLSLLLSLLMVIGMINAVPLTASAASYTITATDNGQLSINSPGEYIFTGTADMCTLDIYSDCTLTLRDLCLINTENHGTYGVRIHSGTTSLIISGENTITAGGKGGNSVPIGVEETATLIISCENDEDANNILNAVGTSDGKAAIGGSWDGADIGWNCGTIVINSGTVNAVGGGNYASVIGRGGDGVNGGDSDNSVTVNGGIITAELKSGNGDYIGGGSMTATYNGGIVTQIDENGDAVTINYNIEPVNYIDADGSTQTNRNYTIVTDSAQTLTAGWHVVTENVTFNDRIRCEGDVHLIICDDMTLTASKGIQVAGSGNSLSVYGQSEGTGSLLVTGADDYNAGIGGNNTESLSSLTINGCTVSVRGGKYGAGIGGGYQSSSVVGAVTVNGGEVTAEGGNYGAGIGGGRRGNGVNFTMNGGEVTATGGQAAAGIGSSDGVNENDTGIQLNAGDVTINGGKVTAQGGDWSAGIGGGNECHCGNILITGGEVTATGGSQGAGIGSGIVWKDRTSAPLENTNTITITGGVVTATGGNLFGFGGDGAACIGSGDWAERSWPYSEASVNISGGTVKAFGSNKGIGGNNSRVAITGGTIEAYTIESTDSIYLSWTENSDSIFTYGYFEEVTLAKSFTDSDGTIYNAGVLTNCININGVKLLPYIPNSYTVTWKNYNGTILETDENVPAGETPVYDGPEPVREPDDTYSYAFSGWSPEVTEVTEDAVYTATYTQTVNAAARINNAEYPSLAEAYEAAADGDTVVLLRDRNENLNALTVSKTLTLDLNGHQFYAGTVRVGAEGDLTVTDTSDEPSAVGLNLSKIVVAEGGAFTMNSGTLTNSATLVFTFEGSGMTLITGNTVLQPGSGMGFSTLTRSDIVEISGSAVVNGVFAHPGGFSLTGGYYQHQPQSEYVAAGYMLLEPAQSDKQDYYQVVPHYVAQVGEALYQFFTDAVTAANGATITLLTDISDPYTMAVGQTIKVIKDDHTLTVNPPEGNYFVKATDSSVTTGEGESAVTVITTTYKVAGAVAKVNDTLYDTFAEAVIAANGAAITLLADISDPYTMAVGQTIKVIKDDHTLTVNPPAGNYLVKETDSSVTTGEGESAVTVTTTTYTVAEAVAKVNDTLYDTFAEAVTAANGATITLLTDISDPYTMAVGQTIKVIKDDHTLTVNPPEGNYFVKATDSSVTTGEGESAVTVTTTTYTVAEAVAKVNDTLYATFAEAATAANSATITLLADILDPYTMAVGQTIKVIKDDHTLTVNPPEGYYFVKATDSSVTTGEGESAVTVITTTYKVAGAVAKVNDTLYDTFAEAVTAANGATITLLTDIFDPYTMAVGQTIKVIKDDHTLTVNPPEGNYFVKATDSSVTTGEGESAVTVTTTTYTVAEAVAKVNDTLYDTFAEAVIAANGAAITLLADISDPYTMTVGQTLNVIKDGYTLTVNPPEGNYLVKATDNSVTTGEGESAVTVTTTTYTVAEAVAKVNDTLYDTFAEAVTDANSAAITLLGDISDPYTMAVGQTIKVIKDDHTLTVNPPEGNYFVKATDSSVTTGEGESAVTVITTTYKVAGAVAKVNDTLYDTFAEAVTAANGATITLLTDISDPYTMAVGQTIKVIKDDHTLTVNPPEGNYFVKATDSSVTTGEGESAVTVITTTYKVAGAVAKVNDTLYDTFAEAVIAANGAAITLLADISDPYTMAVGQTIKVIKDDHTLTVNPPAGNYLVKETDSSVTTGEGESAVTVTTTTYTVAEAVAKVNDTLYDTFAEAVTAANGATITLLTDISDPYTMAVGQTIKVILGGHMLIVNPPSIVYFVVQSTAGGVTTYTLNATVATVNGVGYRAFSDAAAAAGGSAITLLADIGAPYTLAEDQTLRVILGGHSLTVNAPSENHKLVTKTEGSVTVYSSVKYYARVDGTKYESFSAAATASDGTKDINLLRSMDSAYSLDSYDHEILRVVKNGFTANITGAVKTKDKDGVTYYYKSDESSSYTGTGFDYVAGVGISVAAGLAAVLFYDALEGGATTTVTLGAGSSLTLESSEGFEFEAENPAEECLQREVTEEGLTKITNLRTYLVNIDTGISILDVGSDVLPDCVNEIWDDYSKNTASIIKIAPPVLDIVSYTDIRLIFPYPEGWFFPPIPYLPEAMNPGNHFVCFTEGSSWYTYGTPFVGTIVTGPLSISGVWVPYEAAVINDDGSEDYYLGFTDAAENANDRVVEILCAPLASYTLKKTNSDPAAYETLRVKRGSYSGSCVDAPDNLPDGYSMRTWTYSDDSGDVITCYTVDKPVTVTLVYNNGSANSTHEIYSNQIFSAPDVPVRAGSTFSGWYSDAQLTQSYDFSQPVYNDITLYAKWMDNPRYSVLVGNARNGTVTVSTSSTYAGDTVVVTPTPGYHSTLRSLTYTKADGTATPITATAGVYSFVMPEGAVAVDATFDRKYFSGHSLSLNGDIGVNFYVDLTPEEAANATVEFEWNKDGKIQTASVDMSTAEHKEHGYLATCRVSASDMTSDITASLIIDNNVVDTDSYAVKEYADYILSHTDVQEYGEAAELVKAMLNYGANAQLYFVPGTEAEDLANVGYETDLSGVTAETIGNKAVYANTLTDDVTFSGATLSLKSETTLSLYFESTAKLEFECTGMTVETAKSGSYQVARIRGVNARNLQDSFTLTVKDKATGNSYGTVTYSPMTYCKNVLSDNNQPETLQNVCKALYLYSAAAVEYFV